MSLSSLIVQREIASIREIEEALARQVLYGGDFVTNLFEVSRIEEAALMPIVAESFGLPAAPIGELPTTPADAAYLVAVEVVVERAFAPLEVGASLVVAVAEPLSRDAEQELTFALALPIEQRIAPLFRIRQALARDYGVPLDKRIARLITKVVHKGPRIASTFPPPLDSAPFQRAAPRPPSARPPPAAPAPSPEASRTAAAAQGTFVRKTEAPPARPARRRRGPLTADVARTELEASAERDVIFDLIFEFARQFFDYTALFIVHGDLAEGRDAFGDGAARDKVARVGVPLDLRNVLATAREAKRLVRAKPSAEGLDPVLMADLGRDGGTECVVFPIVVRTRVVALLFGDGGPSGIDDVGVRQVEDLVESASGAFERVIMRRKLKGSSAAPEGGAAGAKKKAADTLPPPATQVSAPPEAALPTGSDRPAVEELAPPIRDLMTEPLSRPLVTKREPTAVMGVDPMSVRSDRPPPANLLAVRRPSGRPIPREEPDAGGAGSPSAPPRSSRRSQPLKRAEAPALEFGVPSMPSVVTESAAWGFSATAPEDSVERQLIAEIHGRGAPSPEAPRTTRDPGARGHEPPPSSRSWADDPRANRTSSASDALEALSQSPRAESPPPMRSAPITDVSPQALGALGDGPASRDADGPALGVQARPFARQISISEDDVPSSATPALQAAAAAPSPGASTTLVSDAALAGLTTTLASNAGVASTATLASNAGVASTATLASKVGTAPSATLASNEPSAPRGASAGSELLASTASPGLRTTLASSTGASPTTAGASSASRAAADPKATLLAGSSFVPVVGPGILEARGREASFERPSAGEASAAHPVAAPPVAAPPVDRPSPSGDDASFDLVAETKKPITPLVVVTPDQEMKPVGIAGLPDPDATPLAPAVFDPGAARAPSAAPSDPPGRGADVVLPLAQRKGTPPALPPVVEAKPMPLSEQQVSVPAHRPPSSRSDHSRILPSVIVDVASEYVTLVDRVLAGPDEEAETQLLRAGGYAMPAIMAKFPGPIAIEPERLEAANLPRVAECGPVIRLIASQRRIALPFVLSHVEGPDADARFWATYLLTELVYPDAIDAAIARAFDEDPRVRRAARSAARALAEAHPQPVVERLGEIANTQAVTRRVQAIEALGETREPLAVPVLLPLLEEDIEDVVTAARAALVAITQQDFGRDTDRWLVWWEQNRGRHRLEWLIDSLMHDQRALRGSASEELRTITKEYFAYYDDLPKRERERAQARYREWWENIGRVRFSRASTRGA